ncbi:cell division protein FtsL [Geomicrobium sp. JCM 19039]|uniref:cell division protein FtsL n=1 Tax=Geomicrobium sp. JCM 19039 TaxID=1460636 RepID=UPI00045F1AD6|nr:cell division protein FtsL [Geomicrobium sp. JCM 19039]GAK14509.1 cell division protein FtsL [Geomicrobium sp. JCM 19039]
MSQFAFKHEQTQQSQQNPQVETVQKRLKKRITLGEKCLMMIIVGIILVTALMMISNYATIYSQNSSLSDVNTSISNQQEVNAGLELQVAELSDPERILHLAQENGMQLNEGNVQVVTGE